MSELEILTDTENKLFSRREIKAIFRNGNGLLTRQNAASAIANKLGTNVQNVQIVSLLGHSGIRDLSADIHVFENTAISKKLVPRYLSIRMLDKEGRSKAREELKKSKAAAGAQQKAAKPA